MSPRPSAGAITPISVQSVEGLRAAMAALGRTDGAGVIFGPEAFLLDHLKELIALAMQHRLPAISVYRQFAADGGLISFGPDVPNIFRGAASYVDRILKGADPGELPVQQPDKFELVINLRTARALHLALPTSLLASADELID